VWRRSSAAQRWNSGSPFPTRAQAPSLRLAPTASFVRAGVAAFFLLALAGGQAENELQKTGAPAVVAQPHGQCGSECTAKMAQQEWNYLDLAKIRATLIRQVAP
jgi:hypothetical protein